MTAWWFLPVVYVVVFLEERTYANEIPVYGKTISILLTC